MGIFVDLRRRFVFILFFLPPREVAILGQPKRTKSERKTTDGWAVLAARWEGKKLVFLKMGSLERTGMRRGEGWERFSTLWGF